MSFKFDCEQVQTDGLVNVYSINLENQPITDDDISYLCQNIATKQIVNVNLIGTKITDKSLESLAKFPNLQYLFISNTNITGQGFCYFAGHKKLSTLWLENTQVSDGTLPLIAQIPNLNIMLIEGTPITWQGLLTLTQHSHITPMARGGQFSDEQLAEFRHIQRQANKKNKKQIDDGDLKQIITHLSTFFDAIHAWEEIAKLDLTDDIIQKSTEIYRQFFTENWHDAKRTHLRGGGSYKDHKIVDSEYISKNRLYLYTENDSNTLHRFVFIRQENNSWLLDKMQIKFDSKWSSYNP